MSGLLHALLLDGAGGARPLDWAGVTAWSPNDGVLWLNLDYTQPDAKAWIEKTIDPLVRDALLDPDPRPRAVAHGEDLLLIVRGINANEGYSPEAMLSVRAFIEPRRIVTLRHRVSRSVETIARDIESRRGPKNAAELTVTLVERIVDHAVTHIDELGDAVAASEELVLSETRVDLRGKLAGLRRRAIALRRYLAPQRDALGKLAAINLPWLEPEHKARVGEVADRMLRTVEELDAARDRAAVTQEELSSRSAEATNQRLYVLSLVAAVFLPLGFVCALFSVGVGGVPLKNDDWAFWALIGAFAIFVAFQVWFFRRRGWL